MPESDTEFVDYYPSGWTEEIHDDTYIEYVYDEDPTIIVRVDGTLGADQYSVSPITGVNDNEEEFVTRPISGLSAEDAFDIAATLVYAINGAIGRISGEPEFSGDQ